MTRPLLKRSIVTGCKLMVIFAAIMFMYIGIIIWMYNPKLSELLNGYKDMMPGVMAAMGMRGDTGTLIAFINTYLYGLLFELVPFIFTLMLINNMLVKPMDNGSLACLLASPHSRKSIILTMETVVISLSALFIIICMVFGLLMSYLMFPGELDIPAYLELNGAVLMLQLAISGFCFMVGCLLREAKVFLTLGAGIPLVMYLFQSLSAMSDKLDWLKYCTVFTLFPAKSIVLGSGDAVIPCTVLALIAAVCYVFGGIYFTKRDLSL